MSSIQGSQTQVSNNEQVLAEMEVFLLALSSYPEHFARDPRITFEQHRCSLVPPAKSESDGS